MDVTLQTICLHHAPKLASYLTKLANVSFNSLLGGGKLRKEEVKREVVA